MTEKTSERRARDALDDIDAAIAEITDLDIEEQLRSILHRARFSQPQASGNPDIPGCAPDSDGGTVRLPAR